MDVDHPFVQDRTTVVRLSDGTRVLIRPVVPADKQHLAEGLARLSPRSRYLRFLRQVDRLTDRQLAYLTEIDYDTHFAWGAVLAEGDQRLGLGLARYVRLEDEPEVAEAAVAVLDDYQGKGLGGMLLGLLAETALERGIKRFRSFVLPANERVLAALDRRGAERWDEDGVVRIEVPLPLPPEAVRDSALYAALRDVARGEIRVRPVP